jgi:uncharacterized protein YdhG (YjbR/CyaY superfamily)
MEIRKHNFQTIDAYIAACPEAIHKKLQELRTTIKASAPDAVEKISYQIPTFYLNGNLVHFAAFKDHISFFPTSSGREAFEEELSSYPGGKGTIHFPIDQPLPLELISRIVKFRVAENLKRMGPKSGKRKK